ncbi:Uncharacterised protein [Neisseria meningitidis]|nr:Uncharacterised protein [Neisseria meningitidis]CWQ32046.1 Uncharacterised protein [Neisseria meningitidis]CWT85630.1 Uncharacterised protein [Neisseria meningitidis]
MLFRIGRGTVKIQSIIHYRHLSRIRRSIHIAAVECRHAAGNNLRVTDNLMLFRIAECSRVSAAKHGVGYDFPNCCANCPVFTFSLYQSANTPSQSVGELFGNIIVAEGCFDFAGGFSLEAINQCS